MEATAPLEEDTGPQEITTRAILIVLCSTLATATYSFVWNSVTVALPHMQGAFSATTDQIAWIMIAFVLGSAMTTASVGWFSQRFGRKTVFLVCIAIFNLTLLGSAYATGLIEAVVWRFLQGASGAGLIPIGQAIAVSAFPKDRRGQATSLWALGFVSANVLAPGIAGYLIDFYSWKWVFLAALPVSLATFLAALLIIPKTPASQRKMDWFGFTTLILGVSFLQLMLARGERLDWFESEEILIEGAVALLALYLFFAHSLTAKNSFIDLSIFRNRNFALGQVMIFLIGSVLFLPLFFLPLLLQDLAGYPPIETGNLMLSRGAGSVISLIIMSRIRDSVDPRPILCVGVLLTAYSTWLMSGWTIDVRAQDVIVANLIQGLAAGAVWAPLNSLTLSRLSKGHQDQGFALFYLNFDIGSAIGTAAIVGLHARHSQINHTLLGQSITPFSDQLRSLDRETFWSLQHLEGIAALTEVVSRQSLMIAFNNAFMVISVILVITIPLLLLFRYKQEVLQAAAER